MTEGGLASSGVEGIDEILKGGFLAGRIFLVQGGAGTGKTTLGLQFLRAGLLADETCLYVTLAETEREIRQIAHSHGWPAEALPILHQRAMGAEGDRPQTVFHPAEVELPATVDALLEEVERLRPSRLVIDSLSELRVLAIEPRWFRRELMRLRDRLEALGCTVLLLTTEESSSISESLVGGVLRLEREVPDYGPDRRFLHVRKIRGHAYATGRHDMHIRTGGLAVHPRLVAAESRGSVEPERASTGLPGLDEMLDGGLDRGTASLLLGPTGTGKSTLALQLAAAAAGRGERAVVYVFDERLQTVFRRARSVGIELEELIGRGCLELRQVDPAELTPGEFADQVRQEVDDAALRLLVIDSINAYVHAMPDERLLNLHLHELLAYLSQAGVTSVLVGAQQGRAMATVTGIDISYLADTVLLLRIVEAPTGVRKTLRVYKRRAGRHAPSARELVFEPGSLAIGAGLPARDREGTLDPVEAFAAGASPRGELEGGPRAGEAEEE